MALVATADIVPCMYVCKYSPNYMLHNHPLISYFKGQDINRLI